MSISIITPHYNDSEGLQRIYSCLQNQTTTDWEWVVVDDLSDLKVKKTVKQWHDKLDDKRVNIVFNSSKTNASVCRNKGADMSTFDHIVFLDSDDEVSKDFVSNRQIEFKDFAVLKNNAVMDQEGHIQYTKVEQNNYLNHFLRARFLWPITAIMWDKTFFNAIGKFHPELPRLQDVELAIRGLQQSNDYKVIDNEVDFYYRVIPIRSRKNFVKPVCEAVYLFISKLLDTQKLSDKQLALLSGYYFLSARYLERSSSMEELHLVQRNLSLLFKRKYISFMDYGIGVLVLKLYGWKLLSGKQFLRINRYVFKPKTI